MIDDMIIRGIRLANHMTKSYRNRDKKGPYLTRSFRIPLWASVQIDQHAMRNTGDNNSQALELIIDDWAATKRVRAKFGAEIDALIRSLEAE